MPFNEILVGGPSFAELAGRTLALQELTAYPLIMLENGSMSRIFYRQFFLEHNAELKPDIEAGTTDKLTLVRSDLGLAFVPEPMARGNLHRKRILQMNLQEAIPSRSVCLVYDPRRPLNTAAREFRHQLLESAKTNKSKQKASRACIAVHTIQAPVGFPLLFGGNRVRNATRSAGFPGLQGVR